MTDSILYYVCSNVEQPDTSTDENVEFEMPLYESATFNKEIDSLDLFDMEDLMSYYSYEGERAYFSINADAIKDCLIRVLNVDVSINDKSVSISYHFEDGSIYIPERPIDVDEFAPEEIEIFTDIAKEAGKYMFKVKCEIKGNMLSFERESWG